MNEDRVRELIAGHTKKMNEAISKADSARSYYNYELYNQNISIAEEHEKMIAHYKGLLEKAHDRG